jgi:hypothetical protein
MNAVIHVQPGHVNHDLLGDFEGKTFDLEVAQLMVEHAAFGNARRLSDKADRHERLDALVQAYPQEVRMNDPASQWIVLHLLEKGRRVQVRRVLDLKAHDGMLSTAAVMDHRLERALIHADAHRILAAAV